MTFKIKHIATRFLLQSIFTTLIIATLIFIMFYSGYKKKDTLLANSISEEIGSKIVLARLSLDKAFDLQKADPNFVENTNDVLVNQHKAIVDEIGDSLKSLTQINYLGRYFNKNQSIDSIQLKLNNYSLAFTKTLLSLKEKGNQTGGLIKIADAAINSVYNQLEMAPDNGLQAANFNAYTTAYMAEYSYSKLYQLINFCDEVLSPLYFYEEYDISALEMELTTLRNILNRIEQVDLRLMNKAENTGQIVDLELSYSALLIEFDRFEASVKEQTRKYNANWNWTFTLLAILLTTAYVIVMGRFSSIVRKSVRSLHKITIALAHGNIKDTVPEHGHYEFDAFNKDFKSLFALLNSRKAFIHHLLNEEFESDLEIKADNDEIGNALLKLKDKMMASKQEQIRYNEENTSRRYINEGLAKFAEIMRVNSHNTNLLADEFIKQMVKYMGALQGGLFLTNDDKTESLQLISAFAFDRKRYIQKTIKKGEGLVGTCAVEQKTINLTEIPENYVLIKSGLGDTPPNNLLLLPVRDEGVIVGVIELASLKVFNEIEIELAENIASTLASTIISSRTNLKTAQLLKKSQEQAAEMAEQEEEMRQNMEELKATQEESARREEEMQGLLDAIGKSFFVLEYEVSGKIMHANDRLTAFIEQSLDQILQRSHQEIFSESSQVSNELITNIAAQQQPLFITEELNWGSKKYMYKYNLSPVFASNGEVVKVLNLFNIDEVIQEG